MFGWRKRAALVLGLVGLMGAAGAGCIGIEEKVDVRADGRVAYGVDFTMLEMVAQTLSGMGGEDGPSLGEQWLAAADSAAADSVRLREFVEGADHHFVAERDFASLAELARHSERSESLPESLRAKGPSLPLGGIRTTRLDGGKIRLHRTLENPSPTKPRGAAAEDSTAGATDDAVARRMFGDRVYVFRLSAPAIESVSANGTIAADRKSAEWRIPMTALAGDTTIVVEAVVAAASAKAGAKAKRK